MHPLLHRPLGFMPLMPMHPATRMLLLRAAVKRLPGLQVDGVGVHDVLGDGEDVGDEAIEEVKGHGFADDDAENFGGFFTWGKGVVWG